MLDFGAGDRLPDGLPPLIGKLLRLVHEDRGSRRGRGRTPVTRLSPRRRQHLTWWSCALSWHRSPSRPGRKRSASAANGCPDMRTHLQPRSSPSRLVPRWPRKLTRCSRSSRCGRQAPRGQQSRRRGRNWHGRPDLLAVAVSRRGAFGLLGAVVAPQHGDGGAVKGDHALAAACLGRAAGQVPVVLLQLLADHGGGAVEVDVASAQPGGLAAARSGDRGHTAGLSGWS